MTDPMKEVYKKYRIKHRAAGPKSSGRLGGDLGFSNTKRNRSKRAKSKTDELIVEPLKASIKERLKR